MARVRTPIRAIREHCVECSGGSQKAVKFCSCDGVHSSWCPLWPYRFGVRPETAGQRHGREFVTPTLMPEANLSLEELPSGPPEPVEVLTTHGG